MTEKKINTAGIIGIDAGGTFTDLVFLDSKTHKIKAKVKTPTVHENLINTIEAGLDEMLCMVESDAITSINLATTLATNAIVENRMRPTALILIGYNEKIAETCIKDGIFGTKCVYSINGGHDIYGEEKEKLDEEKLRKIISELPSEIEAIAVAAYFSVRNPMHEKRARETIKTLRPDLYISCGHELSTELDALKRATTAALNAGLIPIVMELLQSVQQVCEKRSISVPITVVRGDGSLVGAEWARTHPVEMIMSGSAASACGAGFLAAEQSDPRGTWIVDMGGTTTDIIRLDEEGNPIADDKGATVGGHKTLVRAIDISTFALGGDTRVSVDEHSEVVLGNRRVEALCRLADEYPHITEELKQVQNMGYSGEPLFVLKGTNKVKATTEFEEKIVKRLEDGPHSREILLYDENFIWLKYRLLENMEEKGMISFASFTPTDAVNVIGKADVWNSEASRLGAEILSGAGKEFCDAESVAEAVFQMAVRRMSLKLMKKNLELDGIELSEGGEVEELIERTLRDSSTLGKKVKLSLDGMLIGAGAPSKAFVSQAGEKLNEKAILPDNCDVAGAVGAAAGAFALIYSLRITPIKDKQIFRLHYPLGIKDFDDLDTAVEFSVDFMREWLAERAKNAGAYLPHIHCERHDEIAILPNTKGKVYLYTELSFEVTDEAIDLNKSKE